MSTKSVGQWVGTLVGAVVGFWAGGNVALGAAIGGMIGGLLDPPTGPDMVGPRLDELKVNTGTYGAPLARGYGTVVVENGNVFWLEGDQLVEHTKTEESGGKGGGGTEMTTYWYSATWAVGLLQVTDPSQVVGLRRLWIGTNLVYDAGSDNIESIIASNSQTAMITFYDGRDDQAPNPRMQADKGVANVSGYPGLCYLVLNDLDLTPYSNTLQMAQVKAELAISPSASFVTNQIWAFFEGSTGTYGTTYTLISEIPEDSSGVYLKEIKNSYDGSPISMNWGQCEYSIDAVETVTDLTTYGWGYAYRIYKTVQADDMLVLTGQTEFSGLTAPLYRLFNPSGVVEESPEYLTTTGTTWNGSEYVVFDNEEIYVGVYNVTSGTVRKLSVEYGVIIASGSQSYPGWIGASENYIFWAVETNVSFQTKILRLNRIDLSLDETWTGSFEADSGSFYVESDEVIYTTHSGGGYTLVVRKWVSGAVEKTWYDPAALWIGDEPFYVECDPYLYISGAYHIAAGIDEARGVIIAERVVTDTAYLRDIVAAECELVGISESDIDLTGLTNDTVRGYRITNAGSVRAALEPLQAAFPFDVAQSGYDIRFVSRGGASVATISEDDLGAAAPGENAQVLFPIIREMDSQLASRVNVKYLDPDREYDIGEQYAERPATTSVGERSVDLAIVLNGTEAAQIADILLSKDWVERREFGPFSLPPTWRHLEPADVVTVEHRAQSYTLRLTRIEYLPDGRLQCSSKQTSAACYTSTATGEDPITVGQSLVPLKGSTTGYLLDMPRIMAEQDVFGMSFALLGLTSGWPGGILARSDDSGNTWVSAGAMNTRARVFSCGAALSPHHGYSPDLSAALTVTPINPYAELYSVTEDQFYSQSNLAAYGADGRWEIVCFKTATDNTGTFTLRDFLRGLYGSEWASGLHESGDLFIMLDTTTVGFFGLPTNALGSPRLYRAITQGATIDSAPTMTDTYEAVNLTPLSPVDINGHRSPTSLDWTIKFQRRSRWPVELFSGSSVPLGETSEAYEVEVWNSDYTTLKRTLSGLTTNEASYTATQQIADFGDEQSTLYLKLRQLSSVIGTGYPLISSIYRNVTDDPYLSFVKLLMHMDDTGLTDQLGHAVTLYGGAARSSSQARFGGYSMYVDVAGDYATLADSSDWALGSADWTIEISFYEETSGVIRQIIGQHSTSAYSASSFIILSNSQKVELSVFIGGTITTISNASTHSLNAWHDLSAERYGSTIYLYLDGTLVDSDSTLGTGVINDSSQPLTLGVVMNGGSPDPGGYYFKGFLDEVRFTPGASRRAGASSYTVASSAFPNP